MHALFVPILAEVADKMNSWPALAAWLAGISIASAVALRRRSWLAIIPGLFALLWTWSAYDILTARFMRPAVIAELGLCYILVQFLPLLTFVVSSAIEIKKRPNQTPEPTPPLVTDRAGARSAPSGVVAHL
jgi:hypothetical protein